jgi:hypothetical protein
MFNRNFNNFNFDNKDKESISQEIRKLLTDSGVQLSAKEYNYLGIWKKKIIELSGDN